MKVELSYRCPYTWRFLDLPSFPPIFSFLHHVKLPNSPAFYVSYLPIYLRIILFFLQALFSIFFQHPLIPFCISLLQASISTSFFSLLLPFTTFPIAIMQKVRFSKQPNQLKAKRSDMSVKVGALKALQVHFINPQMKGVYVSLPMVQGIQWCSQV